MMTLKHLALAGMVGVGAVSGVNEAKAEPIEWGSFEDIVPNASQSNPQGQSVTYVAHSITFRDQNGNIIVDNPAFSLVYFMGVDLGGGYISYNPVGGLDGSGGSASGYFNVDDENYWGFVAGQTANQIEGNEDNGRWRMFVDVNGNGKYGTYDNGVFIPEENEMVGEVRVSNFQAFQTGAGTLSAGDISGWYVVPTLKPLGLSTQALSDGTNVVRFQIAVTNLASFRLECRDSLTNAAWASLGTFAATGAVTEVSDTNIVPSRFYRVVRP